MANKRSGPDLVAERRRYKGTGGLSENNGKQGFWPAFLDESTHAVHLSRTADGQPAPFHCLSGLPESLVIARDPQGRVTEVCTHLVSGFVRNGKFYTRAEAAAATMERAAKSPVRRPPMRPGNSRRQPARALAPDVPTYWANMMLESSILTLRVSWSMACLPFNLATSWNNVKKSGS